MHVSKVFQDMTGETEAPRKIRYLRGWYFVLKRRGTVGISQGQTQGSQDYREELRTLY